MPKQIKPTITAEAMEILERFCQTREKWNYGDVISASLIQMAEHEGENDRLDAVLTQNRIILETLRYIIVMHGWQAPPDSLDEAVPPEPEEDQGAPVAAVASLYNLDQWEARQMLPNGTSQPVTSKGFLKRLLAK